MPIYEIASARGGVSDYEDKGTPGSFKMAKNLDIRKRVDSISAGQDLKDIGVTSEHHSPSASTSPSASQSPSASPSTTASPSASQSPSSSSSGSQSASSGISPSPSLSPSVSVSLSPSPTPSSSVSLSPSPSGGLTTLFADLIKWFVPASDGYTYGFGDQGYIYKIDSSLQVSRVYKDSNGAIKGAAEKPSDSGLRYLYWATDTKLMRKVIPGLNSWNDVETVAGNLTSADYHTMLQIGGALHIANKDVLALVGYDNSYTQEALDLIPGNIAKTLVERSGRSVIGTYKLADPTGGINAAIDAEVPLAQVGSDGGIFFANFTDSIAAKRFPGGGIVNPGGVCNQVSQVNFFDWEENALSWIDKQTVGNLALFAVYNADTGYGGVYSYGRKEKNKPFVLNLDYWLDATELGALTYVNGITMVSYKHGSDYGVKVTDLNNKAEATYDSLDFKAPIKKPINITGWKLAELFMKQLPVGSWVELWYRMDKTGSFIRAYTADGNTTFTTALSKKAVFRIGTEGKIAEIRVVMHPYGNQTPEIYKIWLHFE